MSKFWSAGNQSSEEESEESEEEEFTAKPVGKFGATFSDSDSESDDEVRVVRSQKDKAWDSMLDGITKIKNAKKMNDWSAIQDEFEAVNKMIEKSKMLIAKNGIPKFYIKMLADVEDHVNNSLKDKETYGKMKPLMKKALDRMKLTVKKHNKLYEEQINDFRQHPEKYEEAEVVVEEEEEEDDDSSSDDDDDDDDSSSDDDDEDDKAKDDSSSDEDLMAKPKAGFKKVQISTHYACHILHSTCIAL